MGRRKRITDGEILGIARKLFLERGLQIPTRKLAAEMGISEGVIFQRFQSKEKLISAALELPTLNPEQLVNEAATGTNAREMLENIAIVIFHAFCNLLPLSIPQMMQPEFQQEKDFQSRKSPFQSFVTALEAHLKLERQQGRIRTGSPHATASLIVAALHNEALFTSLAGARERNDGKVRDWIAVFWEGLEAPLKPSGSK